MKDKTLLRRFGAATMAFMLSMSLMAAPAFASDNTGMDGDIPQAIAETRAVASEVSVGSGPNTITVDHAVPKAEYKLYKLLKLEATLSEDGKSVTSYRYSCEGTDAVKAAIKEVAGMDAFKYVPKTDENDTDARHGYGFQIDSGDNVLFYTPNNDGDYDSAVVDKMMMSFADELRKKVDDGTLANLGSPAGTATAAESGDDLTVKFTGADDGYYMVTSNAGSRAVLFTAPGGNGSKTVTMTEKNKAPTVVKQVYDSDDVAGTADTSGGSWSAVSDAQIGGLVKYKTTIQLYKGAENVIVYDNMTDGLTFGELKSITFYPRTDGDTYGRQVYKAGEGTEPTSELALTAAEPVDGKLVGKTDVCTFTENEDGHGFVLRFSNKFTNPADADRDENDPKNNVFLGDLTDLKDDGGRIEIVYTATLNKDAVVGGFELTCTDKTAGHDHTADCYSGGNENETYVKYGHIANVAPGVDPDNPEPPGETAHDKTRTYTYEFSIDKYIKGTEDADGRNGTPLAGAEFEIRHAFAGVGNASVSGTYNAWIEADGSVKVPVEAYNAPADKEAAQLLDITGASTTGKVYRVATADEIAGARTDETTQKKYVTVHADAEDETGTEYELVTRLVTDATGKISIRGLDSRVYAIKEAEAPKGYNKLDKDEMVVIGSAFSGTGGDVFTEDKDAGTDPYTFKAVTASTVGIANASGIRLPDAGGIGTTVFYVVGGVLAAGACVLLVMKKRSARSGD